MATKHEITAAQKAEIEQARAKNKDKKVEYRLKALSMRTSLQKKSVKGWCDLAECMTFW